MSVLTDKFTFDIQKFDSIEEFVFIDSKQQSDIDWDELDLQLFDGTHKTIQPDISKDAKPEEIEAVLGITTETTVLAGNTESNPWGKEELDPILSGSSTVAGASYADLNQPLDLWLSNDNVGETQVVNFSGVTGVKQVNLHEGAQNVVFNSAVKGNVAIVADNTVAGDDATGEKNITLGGGDAVIVNMAANQGKVNVKAGVGNDSVVVQNEAPVNVDMGSGGDDKVITMADANARVSIEGYNATTGAAIVVEEEYAGDFANAIENDNITFGDGVVVIGAAGGNQSKVNIGGASDTNGWIVNLQTPDADEEKIQTVGFTGSNGGTVDGSAFDDVVFVGNKDGAKSDGSSLVGGDGNDTFFGGAGDTIITGKGKDVVKLQESSTRDGAVVNITSGRVTIQGSHNEFADFTGDTLSVDDLDISKMKFSFAGGSLIIKGVNDSGESIYTEVQDVSTTGAGYVNQYIQNGEGKVYNAAIGAESSTIAVEDDEDKRAYAYIGKNSAVDFSSYTKDAFVDLTGAYGSYIDGTAAYFEGINRFTGGEGDFVVMGGADKETLNAGKGNGSLYGGGGLNVLNGYTGSDKEGSTTFFVLGGNDGAVSTINNFQFVGSNNYYDAANVTADQIETQIQYNHFSNVAAVDNDLLLEITSNTTGETEKALLVGAFDNDTYSQDFVVNGIVAQVGKDAVNFDGKADYYYATGTNVTVSVGSSITDEAYIWLDDPDRGVQYEGDFTVIDASTSTVRAELAGNTADNTIIAGSGNTSLWGGNGGNDLLVGGTGTDNFYYAAGNGNDTINNTGSNDNINLVNLTLADLSIETITSSAVVLNFNDGGKLTVNDNNSGVNFKVGDATYVVNSSRTDFEQK